MAKGRSITIGMTEYTKWWMARPMAQCSERVWRDAWLNKQCSNKAVIERDGQAYCRIHDPEYIKQKRAKQEAEYQAESCQGCKAHQKSWFRYCPFCGRERENKSKGE